MSEIGRTLVKKGSLEKTATTKSCVMEEKKLREPPNIVAGSQLSHYYDKVHGKRKGHCPCSVSWVERAPIGERATGYSPRRAITTRRNCGTKYYRDTPGTWSMATRWRLPLASWADAPIACTLTLTLRTVPGRTRKTNFTPWDACC